MKIKITTISTVNIKNKTEKWEYYLTVSKYLGDF